MFLHLQDLINLKNYPDNFIDVGIAEQNMIGVATGLSRNGFQALQQHFHHFNIKMP